MSQQREDLNGSSVYELEDHRPGKVRAIPAILQQTKNMQEVYI